MNSSIVSAKASDLITAAERREYEYVCSKFLSPAEQIEYYNTVCRSGHGLSSRCFFYGGAPGADRRLCIIVPSYLDLSNAEAPSVFSSSREEYFHRLCTENDALGELDIVPLRIQGSGFKVLTHRDYMGSILSLGIERDVIGDIAVTDPNSAVVFTLGIIAPYIRESLTKIGRDGIRIEEFDIPRDFMIPRKFEKKTVIAASDRIDSIVAAITGVSRAAAKELCASGVVELNYMSATQGDTRVCPDDTISVRGYGKYIIESFVGVTGSGRARISVKKYI